MFSSLLLAIDVNDPEGAQRPTQAALRIVMQEQSKLHLLNVVPDDGMPMVSASLGVDHNQDAMDDAKAALKSFVEASLPTGIDPELHVARGKIYDQILKVAQGINVEAIVVGARSPGVTDYLLGSNAARVARHATQSVFVIR